MGAVHRPSQGGHPSRARGREVLPNTVMGVVDDDPVDRFKREVTPSHSITRTLWAFARRAVTRTSFTS